MRCTAALILVLTLSAEGRAEATYLSCSGTLRLVHAGISSEQPFTFSLTINADKKTVMVDDYEPVQWLEDRSKNIVTFEASSPLSSFGVSTGTLNRITGAARIHILQDGLRILTGICKSAQKLF